MPRTAKPEEFVGVDPIKVFFMDLTGDQKRWIERRGMCSSDAEATRDTGMSPSSVSDWLRKPTNKAFQTCYRELCTNIDATNMALLRQRIVLVGTLALENLEGYLRVKRPEKAETDQANLAFNIVKELSRRSPARVGRPIADPDPAGDGTALMIDVETITHQAMRKGLKEKAVEVEETDDESIEEE